MGMGHWGWGIGKNDLLPYSLFPNPPKRMKLITTNYLTQISQLPQVGRHIVAQYDETFVIVYQAYRPAIGNFAGEFKLERMSWIKTIFLWMMYRSSFWMGN
jgi:Domain of unknown function (DUF4291)